MLIKTLQSVKTFIECLSFTVGVFHAAASSYTSSRTQGGFIFKGSSKED